jgi:hypothetical protein
MHDAASGAAAVTRERRLVRTTALLVFYEHDRHSGDGF